MKEGASIKRKEGDMPLKSHSSMNHTPVQVGVIGWQKGVSHGEWRVGCNCGFSVSVLFSLSHCVEHVSVYQLLTGRPSHDE